MADAITFTEKKFKPNLIIDLATLTGAIISALGNERAGLFSNDENLSEYIFQTGEKIENLVWKMPLDKIYGQKMLSKIADLKNIGTPEGSSIQAAAFLQNFVGRTSWAHLDVAGVVWSDRVSDTHSGGATGWGVRLLFEIAKNNSIDISKLFSKCNGFGVITISEFAKSVFCQNRTAVFIFGFF